MKEYYKMTVAGVDRDLPICPLNENLCIAGFVIFGDVELTRASARELLKKAPEFDLLITAESKGIPLAHEMAAQAGMNKYILARKAPKLYMKDPVAVEVKSITTTARQTLYLDKLDMEAMAGKRILIVGDLCRLWNSWCKRPEATLLQKWRSLPKGTRRIGRIFCIWNICPSLTIREIPCN